MAKRSFAIKGVPKQERRNEKEEVMIGFINLWVMISPPGGGNFPPLTEKKGGGKHSDPLKVSEY
jgi:hypothetical protein